jgi:predicted RNA-binding protein with TRAM domain
LLLARSAVAGEYFLYATVIPDSPWNNEPGALGSPNCGGDCPCSDGSFASINAGNNAVMTATAFTPFTLPANEVVTDIRINALGRFDPNEAGTVRLVAGVPGSPSLTFDEFVPGQSDTTCDYFFSDGPSIISLLPPGEWTEDAVNSITVGVRSIGGAPSNTLRCKAIRIRVLTGSPLMADECPGPTIGDGNTPFSTLLATTSGVPIPDCTDEFEKDVWFSYVAPCTGIATFATCDGTDFDSVIAVYVGACGTLTEVGCKDDASNCGDYGASRVTVPVTAGTTYRVRIGGYLDAGSGLLTVSCDVPPPPPANDSCANPTFIGPGPVTFTTLGATMSDSVPPPNCEDMFVRDVWLYYIPDCTGTATFSTCTGTDFDTVIAVYGGSCSNLIPLDCNDEGCDESGGSSVTVDVVQGAVYLVQIGGYGESGNGLLTVSCDAPPPPPANDSCANPTFIGPGPVTFTTLGATMSDSVPPLNCEEMFVSDVWLYYIPDCTGTATFSTCTGTDFDTIMAVYGGSCSNLLLLDCNDEGCDESGGSSVTVDVIQGAVYLVQIGGYGESGNGLLSVSCDVPPPPPANDSCANPTFIGPGPVTFTTLGATMSDSVPPPNCEDMFVRDVWLYYIPDCTGTATFSTCTGTDFDTVMAVYGGSCSNLLFLDCNDEGCDEFGGSSVTVDVIQGAVYLVQIGGYGDSGSGLLTVSCDPAPPSPDLDGDGLVGPSDLALLLGSWGQRGSADLDESGSVGASDLAILIGSWSA